MFQKRSSILTLWEFDLTRWFVKLYYYTFLTNHTFLLFHTTICGPGFFGPLQFIITSLAITNSQWIMTLPLLLFILGTSHLHFSSLHDIVSSTLLLKASQVLGTSCIYSPREFWGFLPGLQASPCSLCLCFPPNSSDENTPMVLAARACICNLLTATWLSLSSSPSQLAPGLK